MKEEHTAALKRYMKQIDELKGNEALSKTLAIEEFKFLDNFKEIMEKLTFWYFGKGFDLRKKQIKLLHPNLIIQELLIIFYSFLENKKKVTQAMLIDKTNFTIILILATTRS